MHSSFANSSLEIAFISLFLLSGARKDASAAVWAKKHGEEGGLAGKTKANVDKKFLTRLCDAAPPSSAEGNTLCRSGGVPTPHAADEEGDDEGDDARVLPVGLGLKINSVAAASEIDGGGGGRRLAAFEGPFASAAAAAAADAEEEFTPCDAPLPPPPI